MALTYAGVNVTAVPNSGTYAPITVESYDFAQEELKYENKAFNPGGLTADSKYFATANGTWLAKTVAQEPAPSEEPTTEG
jgi:hypothetical protein